MKVRRGMHMLNAGLWRDRLGFWVGGGGGGFSVSVDVYRRSQL